MSILGSVSIPLGKAGYKALELTYTHNALWLDDAASMLASSFGASGMLSAVASAVKVPLLGFYYDNPEDMEILSYEYSEYPYLNKSQIVNSFRIANTPITVNAYRAITPNNGVITNILLNELVYTTLKKYCDNGGTFTLMTMWGAYTDLVLEKLKIIPAKDNELGGVGFQFQLKKIQFVKSGGFLSSLSSAFDFL